MKNELLSHIKFYEKFNYITNKLEDILEQEKEYIDLLAKTMDVIDIKLISEITLIHPKVLRTYYKIVDPSNLQ